MPEDAAPAQLTLRAEDLKWTATDEGVTVLDLRTARYLQLNRSGALLWERLSVGATEDELAEALQQRFGIDAARARHDATEFVSALRERGFLAD
jgi:hypothetical protein